MPLQNRVDPLGEIHAHPARGMFTGNRGVIHDPDARSLLARRWTTKAWLVCICDFKGRRRDVMGRNTRSGNAGWTELFFLDEVTALAAGHRPCFYCRRTDAEAFGRAFALGQGRTKLGAPAMDAILHDERTASAGRMERGDIAALPDGAMLRIGGQVYALRDGSALPWSFAGYGNPVSTRALVAGDAEFVTPQATRRALAAGYRPAWHPTAVP